MQQVIAFQPGLKPHVATVVADHHSPLRCRCPLCEVNRRIGLHDSNGVARACDSDTRCYVADLEAANTERLSRPPHLTG